MMYKHIATNLMLVFISLNLHISTVQALKVKINQQSFTLKKSNTQRELIQGLMYTKHLPSRRGMIFFFDSKNAHQVRMWMKNTLIPLDMLFIGPNHKIKCIFEQSKPNSLEVLSCPARIRAVIEINGGEAQKYHIVPGMKIEFGD
ncbi:MAG: DUF192 domain-containing protein [Legionella sp.]|nr:DUF192 domain-containing protein [Legionella sp.]